jgi:hypothetical protein
MTHKFITLLLMIAPFSFGQAAVSPAAKAQQLSIEQTLRGLADQWAKVPVTRDVSFLKRIWSPAFVYIEPSGRVFNKEEGIADLSNLTDKYTSAEVSNFKVRVYGAGTVAVTTGDDREIGRDKNGKPFDRRSRFTNVWVFQSGSWQCVSGHSSDL